MTKKLLDVKYEPGRRLPINPQRNAAISAMFSSGLIFEILEFNSLREVFSFLFTCRFFIKEIKKDAIWNERIELVNSSFAREDSKKETLKVPPALDDKQLGKLILLLSNFRPFKKFDFPTKSDAKTIQPRYYPWLDLFYIFGEASNGSFSLTSKNIRSALPLLPSLPISRLSLSYIRAKKLVHLEKIVNLLYAIPKNELSLCSGNDEFKPLFKSLVKQGNIIQRPLKLILQGMLSAEEQSLLLQFLKNNLDIYALRVEAGTSDDVNGYQNLLQELEKTGLTELVFSELRTVSVNDCKILGAHIPPRLQKLHLNFCHLGDEHLRILADAIRHTAIQDISLRGNDITNVESLGEVLPFTNCQRLDFSRNSSLSEITRLIAACADSKSNITHLNFSESRINEKANLLVSVLRGNPRLNFLGMVCITNGVAAAKMEELFTQLVQAASQHWNIIEGSFFYNSKKSIALSEDYEKILERNKYIIAVQNQLKKIEAADSKQSLPLSDQMQILTKKIPADLKAALDCSAELKGKYPEAHRKCQEICRDLTERANRLDSRNGAACKIQGLFRGNRQKKKDREIKAAQEYIEESQGPFLLQLAKEKKYGDIAKFGHLMEAGNYIEAANMIKAQAQIPSVIPKIASAPFSLSA